MIRNIGRVIDLCLEYDLTFNQLGFISLIWIKKQDKGTQFLYKYCHEKELKNGRNAGAFKVEEVQDLMDKNIITAPRAKGLYFEEIELSDEFSKKIFISAKEAGEELWETFPPFMSSAIQGRRLPAKNISKHYNNMDELFLEYGHGIDWSRENHDKAIESLKIAINQNEISFSIVEWIKSRKWTDFQPKKKEEVKVRLI